MEKKFINSVPEIFNFLTSEYGYKLISNDEYEFIYESNKMKVAIMNNWPDFTIAISENNSQQGTIGLDWIIRYIKPELHYSQLHMSNKDEIPMELKRQSEILKNYAGHVLRGEFNEWNKLREFVDTKIGDDDL